MAKKSDPKDDTAKAQRGLPKKAWAIGVVCLLAGVATIVMGKRNPALPGWLWYVGVALAVVGLHLVFYASLPREQAIEWFKSEVFALSLALTFRWAIAEPYRIPSGSMETTLHGDPRIGRGDRVWVNKWIYGLKVPFMNYRIYHGKTPQRWDIIVFKAIEEHAQHATLVKRIVGLPGERVELRLRNESLRDGEHRAMRGATAEADLFINGERVPYPDSLPKDHYYTAPIQLSDPSQKGNVMLYAVRPEDEFTVVPEGHYLMLGDNSGNSKDGRYYGFVPNEHIVGRVASIFWPPPRWRDFTGFSTTLWWRTLVGLLAVWAVIRLLLGRSVAVRPAPGKGKDHLWVSFGALGLRLPFTRIWIYQWSRPKRGDLVAYHPPTGHVGVKDMLVGRVAGLAGETVKVVQGKLHIDSAPLDAPDSLASRTFSEDVADAQYGVGKGKGKSQVPDDSYFILSEAEGHVADSRTVGWVPRQSLVGKAVCRWWPPSRWGRP